MATIAYFTNGMASTFNSSLEFSRRLVAAGHEVIYASPYDLSERLSPYGYDFTQLTACHEIKQAYGEALKSSPRGIFKRLSLARRFRRQSIEATEIERYVSDRRPDALLIDIELHYAIIATRRFNIPTALPISWFSIFRASGYPPLHTTLHPPTNPQELRHVAWEWRKLLAKQSLIERFPQPSLSAVRRALSPIEYGTNRLSDLRALAHHHDVQLSDIASRAHWLRPHVYTRLPIFSMNAAELDFPHKTPSTFSYVGPMVLANRRESQTDDDVSTVWSNFLNDCRREKRKLLYASLGTFWKTNTAFLKTLIAVVQRRHDLGLVIGLGGKLSPDGLTPLPRNVLAMDYAPQVQILKEADAAITHGGITSINECLHFGVPMLVCCAEHVDQPGCAARIDFHGVGVFCDKTLEADELETQLDRVLDDPGIRDQVRQMQAHYARYESDRVAERAVDRLLKGNAIGN